MGEVTQVNSLPLPPMQYVSLYTEENVEHGRAPSPPRPVHEAPARATENEPHEPWVARARVRWKERPRPFPQLHPLCPNGTAEATPHRHCHSRRPLVDTSPALYSPIDEPVICTLESQSIRRLYPQNYDRKEELKKLNHPLLVNFLDMVDILIQCPDNSKWLENEEDMSLLFMHMHHLINEYRPHQARETLRVLLDMQRRQLLDMSHAFHKHLNKVREILQDTVTVPSKPEPATTWQPPVQVTGAVGTTQEQSSVQGHCLSQDRIMCGIVNTM